MTDIVYDRTNYTQELMQQDDIYRSFVGQRREAASRKVNQAMFLPHRASLL